MSAQYGRWNFDGADMDRTSLEEARAYLVPCGLDDDGTYRGAGIAIVFRGFYTTNETTLMRSPVASLSGAIITWDGRLDNREDLVQELNYGASVADSDGVLVAAAYDKWKTGCFQRLMGDWAVSIWNPRERSLLLAKDFAGTRHLYYCIDGNGITWSTVLDPLVAARDLALNEEYVAGWLSSLPSPDLTPYVEIHSVPPSSFLEITADKQIVKRYWEFEGGKEIRYRTDSEYEEHFRALFQQSILRRLRVNGPVLGELSGGMDSSSIVCMADRVTARFSGTPQIDTVSYYSDDEPNWEERSYFSKVEEKRRRTGLHLDAGSLSLTDDDGCVTLWPGSRRNRTASQLVVWMQWHGHRVVLSGIGGDEFLGGLPTPVPELEDLLARGQFMRLAHQLNRWALLQRRPWIHLLRDAGIGFLPPSLSAVPRHQRPAPWLNSTFAKRHRGMFRSHNKRLQIFGALPSFQENLSALDSLRRQLASTELHAGYPYEKRYPFLDRDLLEFLYAIPRTQLVRPGERRSLMRRALREIVPSEILDRRRKAYVTRAPLRSIVRQYELLSSTRDDLILSSLGIVVPELFFDALEEARQGKVVSIVPLLRTLSMERWLRNLKANKSLKGRVVSIAPSAEVVQTRESMSTSAPAGSGFAPPGA